MDMFVVKGGTPLTGSVAVGGAKNSALPIMAAALAADGPSVLHQIPHLMDVTTLATLLGSLGMRVERGPDGALELEVLSHSPAVADYELVRRMRASVCVLGPLLARRGRACVSLPGGCNIGDRPIDLHLKGLRALGAEIRIERGYVFAEAPRLRGARIFLGGPFGSTVTGTCNVMTAAALADGETTIESAACEPEVVDLGNYLNAMGARISGLGTPFLRIEGVDRLRGVEHTIIPDRIEAATLMIAAAATRGCLEITNVCPGHLTAVIEKLREIGVAIDELSSASGGRQPLVVPQISPNSRMMGDRQVLPPLPLGEGRGEGERRTSAELRKSMSFGLPPHPHPLPEGEGTRADAEMCGTTRADAPRSPGTVCLRVSVPGELHAGDCIALPYPGIPTDVQAQMMALLTLADGISVVTDKVFPDRFMHAPELARLGARIRREGPSAIISGVPKLSGACVMASDLRASAALVVAALAASGESVIRRIYHLDRGYERLERKLAALGADIRRVEDTPAEMPARLAAQAMEQQAGSDADTIEAPAWIARTPSSGAAA